MIPKARSGEAHQDSEPTIAVNPANPRQIAASAFTPDPAGGPRAPIYVSTDRGDTWTLNSILPGNDPDTGTSDITLQFGGSSGVLYAGILKPRGDITRLNILRTTDYLSATPMTVLVDRAGDGIDQPYLQAISATRGADRGRDRLYVGDNYSDLANGRTATIEQSFNASARRPRFTRVRIESRATASQDGPPIRPALHRDGTAYAAFHAWRAYNQRTGAGVADVVVVRDDNGGQGDPPYADLLDPADRKRGVRVVQGARFNFNGYLGLQRTGGDVAIAVDATDSDRVFVAYNDDQGPIYMLHLLRSEDRGQTWSADIRTLPDALNPALAVTRNGTLGFLYQELTGQGAAQRWVTKLEMLSAGGARWRTLVLATTPAQTPDLDFDPYLGDYAHLMAVGTEFYGVFCANNTPRRANFPHGVTYQRNANFATGTLLDVDNATPVHPSIDPFFFRVAG
jgi:hypothetical protein